MEDREVGQYLQQGLGHLWDLGDQLDQEAPGSKKYKYQNNHINAKTTQVLLCDM